MTQAEIETRIEYYSRFLTDRRLARLKQVAVARTRSVSLVLEDVRNPFNATAVTRTCEGLGIHELHVVENEYTFQLNPGVTQGASKWLDMKRWREKGRDNTRDCLESLRERGCLLVATSPHRSGYTPDSLPLDRAVAVVFGHEKTGVSETAFSTCDATLRLPMYGFVESFNLTVSAGICLSRLRERLEAESPDTVRIPEIEQRELLLQWIEWSVPRKVVQHSPF